LRSGIDNLRKSGIEKREKNKKKPAVAACQRAEEGANARGSRGR
jgi:hypothetical protein